MGVCLLASSACTSDGETASPASTPSSGIEVHGGTAAKLSHGGVTVALPGSSVTGEGRLNVDADEQVPATAAGLTRVGTGVRVELSGAQLSGRATVEFTVPPGWDPNLVPVVAWQDGRGGWRWLPTSPWKPGQPTVTAQTDHFSSGFLGGFDVTAAAKDALGRLGNWMTGRAGVAQPQCKGEASLRTAVTVSSDGGDSVKWCAGVESGRTVLRIANNRLAYTQVTYPTGWKVVAGNRFGFSADALIQFLGTQAEQIQKPRGRSVVLIRSGESITLQLPAVPDAKVLAEISQMAYGLQILELASAVRGAVMRAAGQAVKSDGWVERLAKTVTSGDPSKAWIDTAKTCLDAFRNAYTDNIFDVAKAADVVKQTMSFTIKCTGAMARVSLAESGVGLFLGGLVLGVVDLVVSTIGTALSLIILSAREIWDSVASFGGKSNPIYGIHFVPKLVPTEVIRVNPLAASGEVKPGWQIEDTGEGLECAPFDEGYPSPAAVSANIYSCGSAASGADVCWVAAGGPAICGGEPWEKKVYRWTLVDSALPAVKPEADPWPWGLQLADGTRCRLRNGGSWSGRPDGWNGAYYCKGVDFVVLSDSNDNYRHLDRSSPTWKVWIGKLDDSATSLPAPKLVPVAKAYFASR
ncbi:MULTISPECIES: hypothetical protein [unclassified Kribbella]|uniref:hypothetical protein n=1 Tax=unclassified Kribbella TaxID=2644121 RepID=UPI003077D839